MRKTLDAGGPTLPSADERLTPAALAPGQRLAERYTVLGFLGEGGMGLVLAAYDARLDRRVALKLLRHRADGSSGREEQARLVREAQAMARLSHPNVVAVYDAGTLADGALFIAMEYVEGQTLREWCAEQPRSWRQVLETFLAAGRGLAAAHAAGLVHRDFKPDNVLVGKDGRARVTDFGLARHSRPSEPPALAAAADAGTSSGGPLAADDLTVAGTLVGTPRYMAPELLLEGRPADVHTDVFSFCVALYEALYGQFPVAGKTLPELLEAYVAGRVKPLPAASDVPAWVARTVSSGLSFDPSRRPASMEVLLAELADDPQARRRGRALAAGLALLLAVLSGLLVWGWLADRERGCGRMDRHLAGIWDADTKARVAQALTAAGVPYAADTARRTAALLDDYAAAWVTMRTEVCEAQASAAPPGSLAALRESCLERRRSRLRALTELLASGPDRGLVDQAVQAVKTLPSLDFCADADALTAAVPPPEDATVRARVETLEAQADRLEALYEAGKYPEGLALGEALLREVEPLGYAPLHARVLLAMAELREPTGDYEGAKALARQAIVAAARGKDTRLAARSWSQLLFVVGGRQARGDEALQLSLALEAAVELADDPIVRADADNTLGLMYTNLDRFEEARQRHAEALALREQALGPEHPHTALSLTNLGRALLGLGRYEEARQADARALALREKVLGPEHPANAFSLNHLGAALVALGRYEEARDVYERALGLRERAVGPDDPATNGMLHGLGNALGGLGRLDEAREAHERALALREKAVGPQSHLLAEVLNGLGRALRDLGRREEARLHHERALALQEQALGPLHPSVAESLLGLAELELAAGRPTQALPLLERALSLAAVDERANVQLALAEALWQSQQDRARARSLATAAETYWRELGHAPALARASAWLATHPGT
ncbi:serine/threonine protein kinase [Nannocystis exedens]|uniref:Serine/threonine protein kinase n=1 Tax=Nannocystis exedens TaxID=54 RepID=A0A1I2GYX1_9BACT|nr:serine/threonine-protein kinase [Nannocystis exedens]PCC68888.1 Serine/threonine-protein kinase PK-1 [Nannocystis exedens]SFF22259.1 serine/threonine protein kinase [Nannocystis exedens]